jgi:RND family efflux transporter MFP subunit
MSSARRWIYSLLSLLLLLLLIAVMAGSFNKQIEPDLLTLHPKDTGDTYRVQWRRIAGAESVPATVEARETTIVASRLLARVDEILVRAGDYVEPGQLLARLEKKDLAARAAQAEERLRGLRARRDETIQNLQRAEELHQRQLIADADLDAARANALAIAGDLAAAEQALVEAQTALSYAEIRSPLAGRVVERFAEPGDTVSPGAKLVSLYNPFSLRIEAWVRESIALTLQEGQVLKVDIPALGRSLEARIEERVPAADPGSRAFRIKAMLPSEPGLLPGLYARLAVPRGEEEVMIIPEERIARVGQLNVAWVQGADGPVRRFLRLGEPLGEGMIVVTAGLAAGDELLMPPAR